jgi:hypothetical protein
MYPQNMFVFLSQNHVIFLVLELVGMMLEDWRGVGGQRLYITIYISTQGELW